MSDFRYNLNMALMGALESAYGTEQTTFASTDVILLTKEPEVEFEWINAPRELALPYYGASEEVPATAKVKMKFTTELVPSGTAGTPPAIGKWLIACGMQETIFAGNRVEYVPISQNQSGLTKRFFNDGVRYISKGARGRVKLNLGVTKIPTADFEMWSFARQEAAVATPAVDYAAFKLPEAVTDANSGDIRFGSALAAGVLTGGTAYKSKGLMLDIANDLQHYINLGGEDIGIKDRNVTGQIIVALSEAQELQWYTDVRAVTYSSVSFSHGSAAGKKLIVFGPKVQRVAPKRYNDDGRLMFQTDLRYIPVNSDNDFTLVFK